MEEAARGAFRAKADHVVRTDLDSRALLYAVDELALVGPVELAEAPLIVGTRLLLPGQARFVSQA